MKTRTITRTILSTPTLIPNRMLFTLHQRITHFKKVSNFFPLFFLTHHCSSNPHKSNKSHIGSPSIHVFGIAKSVLDKCTDLLVKTPNPSTSNPSSLREFLLNVSHLNPRISRKFWRKSVLEPRDVLELLLGFESNVGKSRIDVKKVRFLWEFFKLASEQGRNFKHIDQSFKIMVELLVRVGLFKDAESLLLAMDKEGILLDNHEIFSDLIQWHVSVDELEKSINMYDRMRLLNLAPTSSCYHTLVDYLAHKSKPKLLFQVFDQMLETGLSKDVTFENVIQVLCKVQKVQDSRNLIKKAFVNGIKPTKTVLDAITCVYCEKMDYDDLLSLFADVDIIPHTIIGNKIVNSLCQNLGVERSVQFLKELEHLGFSPDAITFGILIGWSCREGNLKNAFLFLANLLSRGLKPELYSYNSLISGVFNEGLLNHAIDILHEMDDMGVVPNMSTFRVLLAGYCKARRFDDVKVMIKKMVHNGLIKLSPLDDPISKAFIFLGIDPLGVRLRRDNNIGFPRTEFFDNMGNGLYLEGNVVEFDEIMKRVLDDSMILDFNRVILNDNGLNCDKSAYMIINELVHWGQELSVAAFKTLLNRFHESNSSFKTIIIQFEKNPKLHDNLDEETLNLLVQAHVKTGFLHKARKLFDEMLMRNWEIDNKTYSALVTGLCKKGNPTDLQECHELARNGNWLPSLNDYKTLICSLSKNDMLIESLILFEHAILNHPHEITELVYPFLETLCGIGFTKTAHVLLDELVSKGHKFNQVAYNHLLRGFLKEKHFPKAFVISDNILTSTALDLDVSVLLNVLIHRYCAAKNLTKVNEVLGVILKKNITISVSSYSTLVSLTCNKGQTRFAFSIKDCFIKQISTQIVAYNILIFHLFASGNSLFVDTVLNEIQQTGLEYDSVTYNFLVYGFSKYNPVSRSVQYMTEMMSKELTPSNRSLRAVIRSLSANREFNKVLNLSQEMETRSYVHCSVIQNEIVEGFLKMGELEKAVNFLDNMIINDLVPKNINYDNLIKKMCCFKRLDKAFDLFNIMLTKENIPDSTTYDRLIQDSCFPTKIEEALDLYTEMLNLKLVPSVKTHEVLIEKLCGFRRMLEAEKVLDAMVCLGECPSEVMFGLVVSGYHFERNFSKASEILQTMQRFGYKPDFETHWSLVRTLSKSSQERDDDNRNFLSRLLSKSGFSWKNRSN